jgi:hypothetical protein
MSDQVDLEDIPEQIKDRLIAFSQKLNSIEAVLNKLDANSLTDLKNQVNRKN